MLSTKRQKLRAQELQQIKDNILNNLPNLNKREIRRHRIPYFEARILELLEDGFEESANFLGALLAYQNHMYGKHMEEAIILNKPMLQNDKPMIDIIYDGFKIAETAMKNNHKGTEIDKLLELAIFFSHQIEGWWWLAEQLFIQCVNSAKEFHGDGAKRHAIIRYIFGRFLLKQMNDVETAKQNLRICRDLSNGQNWTAGEVLKIHQGTLFKECCVLLFQGLLIMCKERLYTDPAAALKLSTLAYKRALDAEDSVGEAECLFQQGLCEMELGSPQPALHKFSKVLIMHFSTNNKPGICNTRIQLALAHSKLDNMSEAKYHLHQLLDYTHKHDMKYYHALAHRYLGEIYLVRNIGHEASSHLLKALEIFHELEDFDNREQAKNLAAIASGLQLIRPLMKLINGCDKQRFHYIHNVIKLVRWKDSRVEFWDEEDENDLNFLKKYMDMYGEYASTPTSHSKSYITYTSHDSQAVSEPVSHNSITTISQFTLSSA